MKTKKQIELTGPTSALRWADVPTALWMQETVESMHRSLCDVLDRMERAGVYEQAGDPLHTLRRATYRAMRLLDESVSMFGELQEVEVDADAVQAMYRALGWTKESFSVPPLERRLRSLAQEALRDADTAIKEGVHA